MELPLAVGRGSHINPAGRFSTITFDDETEEPVDGTPIRTQYFNDDSKSIISENNSPDVPFRYSLNPYRGCSHGCSYCFARPSHEYLDLSAGLDFETKIFVKRRAADLFRQWLLRPKYVPETVAISGVTDCYQPVEKQLGITRQCLEVALDARQPISIITKNALVLRDLDLLSEMAKLRLVRVCLSVTTLEQSLTRVMEPRTSSPAARLRAIRELSNAGVPVHVLVAPVVPGLTDHEIPAILQAVREAGAETASYILLRLPSTVKPVFLEWLERTQPELKTKVEARIRDTRGGELYETGFGRRMTGRGETAEQIGTMFKLFARKYNLDGRGTQKDFTQFRQPKPNSGQQLLFR